MVGAAAVVVVVEPDADEPPQALSWIARKTRGKTRRERSLRTCAMVDSFQHTMLGAWMLRTHPTKVGCVQELPPGAAEALFSAGRVFKGLNFMDRTGENGDGNHLGDLLAGFEFDGSVAEVGHKDENFAPVA